MNDDITNSDLPDQANLISRTANTLRGLADQLERGTLIELKEWIIPIRDIGTDRMIEHCNAISIALGKKHLAVYALCLDEEVPLDRIYEIVDGDVTPSFPQLGLEPGGCFAHERG